MFTSSFRGLKNSFSFADVGPTERYCYDTESSQRDEQRENESIYVYLHICLLNCEYNFVIYFHVFINP